MRYQIKDFTSDHIKAAEKIACREYERAHSQISALPAVTGVPSLLPYAQNGLGVAAFSGGQLMGFLCSVPPFPRAFRSTDAVGVFSPMGANGAVFTDRAEIYAQMYQAAGKKWAAAGASSHTVCLYACDGEAERQLFRYGFGLRCIDAIRRLDKTGPAPASELSMKELAPGEMAETLPLAHALDAHMAASPTFLSRPSDTESEYLRKTEQSRARLFAAYDGKNIVAFLKTERNGETFIGDGPGYLHITGAFCLPEYRGKGINAALLYFTMHCLKRDGAVFLGVDFESINPAADHFWRRHFDVYTHSVVRRIDEHSLGQ